MKKYILTVDWCKQEKRGVFSDRSGNCYWKTEEDGPHTEDEMFEILGIFELILDPESTLMSEEEMTAYKWFTPLAEYTDHYGIVRKEKEDA